LETLSKEREGLREKKVTLDNKDYKAFQGGREEKGDNATLGPVTFPDIS
jgi:hypothetical protein